MINLGLVNQLKIIRETGSGLFLGDKDGEEVLLPFKSAPRNFSIGDKIDVFIYMDKEDRKIATTSKPLILLNEVKQLKVKSITKFGAFLDWGLERDLFVPISEQRETLFKGEVALFTLQIDYKSGRLFASSYIERFFHNEYIELRTGDQVSLVPFLQSELGYSVIINSKYKGIIYNNEIFKKIKLGKELSGWVKKIREDNKVDISLQPLGYKNSNDKNIDVILKVLNEHGGFIGVNDKSAPDDIYNLFAMSKKAFKKAIGSLYKSRSVTFVDDGIKIITEKQD